MKKSLKTFLFIITCLFVLSTLNSCHSNKGPYNPYLDLKVKPHQEEGNKTKKASKNAAKAYRKQLRSNRKAVFGRKVAPK